MDSATSSNLYNVGVFFLGVTAALFEALFLSPTVDAKAPLRMRCETAADGTLNGVMKIMQITDLHFGEAEFTTWGPMQDVKSIAALHAVL